MLRKRLSFLLLAVVLLLTMVVTASAETPPWFGVTGQVTDSDGNPDPYSYVMIECFDANPAEKLRYGNASGYYQVKWISGQGLPDGYTPPESGTWCKMQSLDDPGEYCSIIHWFRVPDDPDELSIYPMQWKYVNLVNRRPYSFPTNCAMFK